MQPYMARTICVAFWMLLGAPVVAQSHGLADLTSACAEGRASFEERTAKIEALGYSPVSSNDAMWVEAQLAHIALSDLAIGGTDDTLRETYLDFRQLADGGDLFRTDIREQSFVNDAGNIVINFSDVDGDMACSIAYGIGATALPVSFEVDKTWTSEAGSYTEYRMRRGLVAMGSRLGSKWDQWIPTGRRAAGFLILGKDLP